MTLSLLALHVAEPLSPRAPKVVTVRLPFHAGADLAKILGIIAVGMPASLLVTAQVTVLIRNAVKTDMEEQPPVKRLPPFTTLHYAGWGARACPARILQPALHGHAEHGS